MEPISSTFTSPELKKRIMRRVYATWFLRSIAPLLAVEVLLLGGVAVGVLTHISLRSILMNALSASGDIRAFVMFFVNNFFIKSIQSRLLVVAYLVVAFFFARDLRNAVRRFGNVSGDFMASLAIMGNRR
jgi:hypothetical protein